MRQVIKAGVDVFGKTIYFNDPDGNGVEIYRDRLRGEWPQTQDGGIDMGVGPLDLDALLAEAEQHAQNMPARIQRAKCAQLSLGRSALLHWLARSVIMAATEKRNRP